MQKQRPKKSEALTAGTGRASSEATKDVNQGNIMSDSKGKGAAAQSDVCTNQSQTAFGNLFEDSKTTQQSVEQRKQSKKMVMRSNSQSNMTLMDSCSSASTKTTSGCSSIQAESGSNAMSGMTKSSPRKSSKRNTGCAESLMPTSASLESASRSTSDESSRAITVPFHGSELYVVEYNGQPYTPMKPIVTAMGLDWGSQFRKVAANEARWGVLELRIPSAATVVDSTIVGSADGKSRELTCIPVRKVAAWLATVEPGKVKNPDVRARVVMYQNECDDALWQYWNEGIAVNPRAVFSVSPNQTITGEQAETLRLMLTTAVERLPKHKQAAFMRQAWGRLKSHYKVSYRQIPVHEFSEAVSIIARHTAEWEVVDDEPEQPTKPQDSELLKSAFSLATEVAASAMRTVFDAVIDGKDVSKWDRWMFCLNHDREGKPTIPWAKPIQSDAMVVSMKELPTRILEPNGMMSSDEELANLASACTQRLAARAAFRMKQDSGRLTTV